MEIVESLPVSPALKGLPRSGKPPRERRNYPKRHAGSADTYRTCEPGAPWGPMGAPMGPHGPHGSPWAPSSPVVVRRNFEKFTKIGIFPFLGGPKWVKKKLRLRGWDPPSHNRAAILRPGAVSMSQMVAWRPIWWQKGWFWSPLGFRAQPAHPAGGRQAGGRANSDPTGVPLPTHTPKIAIPRCGGRAHGPHKTMELFPDPGSRF